MNTRLPDVEATCDACGRRLSFGCGHTGAQRAAARAHALTPAHRLGWCDHYDHQECGPTCPKAGNPWPSGYAPFVSHADAAARYRGGPTLAISGPFPATPTVAACDIGRHDMPEGARFWLVTDYHGPQNGTGAACERHVGDDDWSASTDATADDDEDLEHRAEDEPATLAEIAATVRRALAANLYLTVDDGDDDFRHINDASEPEITVEGATPGNVEGVATLTLYTAAGETFAITIERTSEPIETPEPVDEPDATVATDDEDDEDGEDGEEDGEHDDNDDCAKYLPDYAVGLADGETVSVEDLEEGDVFHDPADADGVWRRADEVVHLDDEVHVDSSDATCERCKQEPVTDEACGLGDACTENNNGRVVL